MTLWGVWKYQQEFSNGKTADGELENMELQFDNFSREFGKKYTQEERMYRLRVFAENKRMIDHHNDNRDKSGALYTLGINKFADLTWEEFKAAYLTKFSSDVDHKCTKKNHAVFSGTSDDDKEVDWEKKGFVQDVKDQAMCGSCWAFSAVGAMESSIAIKNQVKSRDDIPDLSEQELVDCSKPYGNEGCNGGYMNLAFDYVLDHKLNTGGKYPYRGWDQKCRTKELGEGEAALTGCVQVDANTTALTEAIRVQPVAVGFYVNMTFQFYFGGIFNPWFCNGEPNHGVLAVGFNLSHSTPYYRIKNSWSDSWGEKGYFRMAIGKKSNGTCNIAGHKLNYYPLA